MEPDFTSLSDWDLAQFSSAMTHGEAFEALVLRRTPAHVPLDPFDSALAELLLVRASEAEEIDGDWTERSDTFVTAANFLILGGPGGVAVWEAVEAASYAPPKAGGDRA